MMNQMEGEITHDVVVAQVIGVAQTADENMMNQMGANHLQAVTEVVAAVQMAEAGTKVAQAEEVVRQMGVLQEVQIAELLHTVPMAEEKVHHREVTVLLLMTEEDAKRVLQDEIN